MKFLKYPLIIVSALAIVSCGGDSDDSSADTDEPAADTTSTKDTVAEAPQEFEMPDSTEMMKRWMDYATPGETHAMMAKGEGEWIAKGKYWETPGGEPREAKEAKAVVKMDLGGRFSTTTYTGEMWGMPYEGKGLLSYNNHTQEFTNVWYDNTGTGLMILTGTIEDNVMTLTGTMKDPIMKCDMKVRETFEYVDDNTQVLKMFFDAGQGEFQNMEITFTRM